jgi:hypothetical protein
VLWNQKSILLRCTERRWRARALLTIGFEFDDVTPLLVSQEAVQHIEDLKVKEIAYEVRTKSVVVSHSIET